MKPKKQGKSVQGNRKVQQNRQSGKKMVRAKSLPGHSETQQLAASVKARKSMKASKIQPVESTAPVKKTFDEKHQYYHIINQVVDPEVGVGIADMGIIYSVDGPDKKKGVVNVTMTLTSMGCPAGPEITGDIDEILRAQKEVKDVEIEVVWDPPWNPDMMKPEVRAILFGGIE